MSSRAGRFRALIAVCGAAAWLAATAGSAAVAAGTRGTNLRLVTRCAKLLMGEPMPGARAVSGPAAPQVAAELSIFRATRTSADTLPATSDLDQTLAGAQATTYDPSASVRLNLGRTHEGPVYAIPATLAAPPLPARCAHPRSLAGLRVAFALRAEETGTGPGVCVITTHHEPAGPPVSALPGKLPLPGTKARTVATAGCESLTVMSSYLGTLGAGLSAAGVPVALLPDGISSITATLADGHQTTAPVAGNLIAGAAMATSTGTTRLGKVTRARLVRLFDAGIPVTVTEYGPDGTPIATFDRPVSLIPEFVRESLLLLRLVDSSSVTAASTDSYVSCSARTHRCVAVVVSSACDTRRHRCDMTRRIMRYRYMTRRPPRGTTGPVVLPTGRIRARLTRYLVHPGKLSLVLNGTPHHRAEVLVSINCFSHRGGGSVSGTSRPPLRVAVPSRTPVVRVGRHRQCGVGVLVVSSQPGRIQARLARG